MNAGMPARPGDVPDATYRELADAHMAHLWPLVDAHHGIGEPRPAAELAEHAIAALATQHALAERILHTRWCTARDALVYGASLSRVAAAMGLDLDELTAGLCSWAEGQLREHLMTRAQHDAIFALLDTPEADGTTTRGPAGHRGDPITPGNCRRCRERGATR